MESMENPAKEEVSALARGLSSARSHTVALMVPDVTNPFFTELVHAVEQLARARCSA